MDFEGLKKMGKTVADHPELLKEWDYQANSELPENVNAPSKKKAYWIGSKCSHHWDASISERLRGYGCPICSGKRIVPGINDFGSRHSLLAKEWHPTKNGDLLPTMLAATSHKTVWWLCAKGHQYESSIDSRVRGRGCPYCAHKLVLNGINDLATVNPRLADEWSDKNSPLKPTDVFANSHKRVFWRCALCHEEWSATIGSRQAGNGCPKCAKRMQSSFPEQAIYYYVHQAYPDAVNGYREIFDKVMELDIYVPTLSLGIEYDGNRWHSNEKSKSREKTKYSICKEKGITLLRIREKNKHGREAESDDCDVQINVNINIKPKDLNLLMSLLSSYLPDIHDIDVERDRTAILAQYISGIREKSLESLYPELVKEWHPTKNGDLLPSMFSPRMDKKVWWQCPLGHAYEDTPAHRTGMGTNCPYCSNRRLLIGFNDFKTTNTNAKLFAEWDTEKNLEAGIAMDGLTEGSKKKVFWICPQGHSYRTTMTERKRGSGCPVCVGRIVQTGVNDLASVNPALAEEWHPTKNGSFLPTQVTEHSNKKVWWKCSVCGGEWETQVNYRSRGPGCPYCYRMKRKRIE